MFMYWYCLKGVFPNRGNIFEIPQWNAIFDITLCSIIVTRYINTRMDHFRKYITRTSSVLRNKICQCHIAQIYNTLPLVWSVGQKSLAGCENQGNKIWSNANGRMGNFNTNKFNSCLEDIQMIRRSHNSVFELVHLTEKQTIFFWSYGSKFGWCHDNDVKESTQRKNIFIHQLEKTRSEISDTDWIPFYISSTHEIWEW